MKFGIRGYLTDIITYVKFLVDRFRGYRVLTPQIVISHLTCCVALTTVYALLCDTVIHIHRDAELAKARKRLEDSCIILFTCPPL